MLLLSLYGFCIMQTCHQKMMLSLLLQCQTFMNCFGPAAASLGLQIKCKVPGLPDRLLLQRAVICVQHESRYGRILHIEVNRNMQTVCWRCSCSYIIVQYVFAWSHHVRIPLRQILSRGLIIVNPSPWVCTTFLCGVCILSPSVSSWFPASSHSPLPEIKPGFSPF